MAEQDVDKNGLDSKPQDRSSEILELLRAAGMTLAVGWKFFQEHEAKMLASADYVPLGGGDLVQSMIAGGADKGTCLCLLDEHAAFIRRRGRGAAMPLEVRQAVYKAAKKSRPPQENSRPSNENSRPDEDENSRPPTKIVDQKSRPSNENSSPNSRPSALPITSFLDLKERKNNNNSMYLGEVEEERSLPAENSRPPQENSRPPTNVNGVLPMTNPDGSISYQGRIIAAETIEKVQKEAPDANVRFLIIANFSKAVRKADWFGDLLQIIAGQDQKGKSIRLTNEKNNYRMLEGSTLLPADWKPNQETLDWAKLRLAGDRFAVRDAVRAFRDEFGSKVGMEAYNRDWNARFRAYVPRWARDNQVAWEA